MSKKVLKPTARYEHVFLNNKKIPILSTILKENKFTTDFKEKVEFFNTSLPNNNP